jgi:hypothetical protein
MINIDELLPSAKEIQKQSALEEAKKAEEQMRRMAAVQAEKQALTDGLTKSSGLSEEEKIKRASTVIQRAVRNGLNEVQVYRFPNIVCTDRGRAINQMEEGWEKTLTSFGRITCSRAVTRSPIRSSIFPAAYRATSALL